MRCDYDSPWGGSVKRPVEQEVIEDLAAFRYTLRKFLRFSENAARECGVTPQQHQLLLGIAGFTGKGRATISELAEFLQERNNSVVGLVERAVEGGLVRRQSGPSDKRTVVVSLTRRGEEVLSRLALLHHEEVKRVRAGFLNSGRLKPQAAATSTAIQPAKQRD
jgi:DNA-binding MarR family transcriptional regulator